MTVAQELEWLDLDVTPSPCERGRHTSVRCPNEATMQVTITCQACNKSEDIDLCSGCYAHLMSHRYGRCRTFGRRASIYVNRAVSL